MNVYRFQSNNNSVSRVTITTNSGKTIHKLSILKDWRGNKINRGIKKDARGLFIKYKGDKCYLKTTRRIHEHANGNRSFFVERKIDYSVNQ